MPSRILADLSPLRRSRDLRLLITGQSISLIGSQITLVAVPYQVFTLTGSSLAVGLVSLVELAPLIVLSLIGGAYADAIDRRRVLFIIQVTGAPRLGDVESGVVRALIGTQLAVLTGGLACLAGLATVVMWHPGITRWRVDALGRPPQGE